MAFSGDVGTWSALLAASLTIGLAAWLLILDFESALHRAFALLLWLQGLFQVCFALTGKFYDLPGRLYVYYAVALPFAALHFAGVFRDRHRGARKATSVSPRSIGLLALALSLELAYFLDHGLNRDLVSFGPYQLFGSMTLLTNAAIAALFAIDSSRGSVASSRRSFLLVSLGFMLEPAYRAAFEAVNFTSELLHGTLPRSSFVVADQAAHLVPLAVVVATTLLVWRRLRPHGAVGYAWAVGIAVGIGCGMGFLFGVVLPASQHGAYAFLGALFRSLADLALPAVVGYALLRYHLFDIDLKVKSTLRQSVAAALLAVIFFVTSNALQFFFPAANLATALGVAGAVALALWPAERLAKRLVDRWLPGVSKTPDYIDGRRRDLYQSALEQAFSDGNVTFRERRLLDRLRSDLGITDREAVELEKRVQTVPG